MKRTPLKRYTPLRAKRGFKRPLVGEKTVKRPKSRVKKKVTSRANSLISRLWSVARADREFSIWIRNRDKWRCKRCGKKHEKGSRNLTNSHFWPRQHRGTRFDPENCDSICWIPCHKYEWEKEKQGAYREFKIKELGVAGYQALEARARGIYPQSKAIMDVMKLLGKL